MGKSPSKFMPGESVVVRVGSARGLTIVYSATVVKDLGPRVRVRDDSGQVTVARSKDVFRPGEEKEVIRG
jgi:hypothetical protein